MTTLVLPDTISDQTSAFGSMLLRAGAIGIVLIGTGLQERATAGTYQPWTVTLADRTISGPSGQLPARQPDETLSPASAILEIRRRSGLTWEEMAALFEVSRRSVHHWASGKPVSASHHREITHMLTAIRTLDRGEAARTRDFLRAADASGNSPLDLLSASKFEEAAARAGGILPAAPPHLTPLSERSLRARRPAPPASLLDASQDRSVTPAKARVGAAVRARRKPD